MPCLFEHAWDILNADIKESSGIPLLLLLVCISYGAGSCGILSVGLKDQSFPYTTPVSWACMHFSERKAESILIIQYVRTCQLGLFGAAVSESNYMTDCLPGEMFWVNFSCLLIHYCFKSTFQRVCKQIFCVESEHKIVVLTNSIKKDYPTQPTTLLYDHSSMSCLWSSRLVMLCSIVALHTIKNHIV